jgi:hypothetical protein
MVYGAESHTAGAMNKYHATFEQQVEAGVQVVGAVN